MTDTPTTKRPKRRYTDEFKREALALWRSFQAIKTMVAAELGIERRLLSPWVSLGAVRGGRCCGRSR